MSTATPAPGHRVTMVAALLAALDRGGWAETTPTDKYTRAAGIRWLQPRRAARSGHTPARVTVTGETLSLVTFDRKGAALEQVTWSWVDPENLARVHAYVTAALADALTERGEL